MQYDHAEAGRLNCVGHPVTFLGEERCPGLPPPMLGQHTDEVLKEMGLSAASIAELRHGKIVG
jgi:formyl-CoA transferase